MKKNVRDERLKKKSRYILAKKMRRMYDNSKRDLIRLKLKF